MSAQLVSIEIPKTKIIVNPSKIQAGTAAAPFIIPANPNRVYIEIRNVLAVGQPIVIGGAGDQLPQVAANIKGMKVLALETYRLETTGEISVISASGADEISWIEVVRV